VPNIPLRNLLNLDRRPWLVAGFALLLGSRAGGEPPLLPKTFSAIARDKHGKVVYLEKHTLVYKNSEEIQSAFTVYERESGEILATLTSDFSLSISTPEHVAINRLNGDRYGVRRHGAGLQMFKQDDSDEKERTKDLEEGFSGDSLAVAGQGINYYVQQNLDKIAANKTTKLTLLIPGRLQYFSFRMEPVAQKDGILFLEFTASNFFIRLFVPKIEVQFDLKMGRMIRYEGVSNISDVDGKIRELIITYDYPEQNHRSRTPQSGQ
jgi:hypothetical protein